MGGKTPCSFSVASPVPSHDPIPITHYSPGRLACAASRSAMGYIERVRLNLTRASFRKTLAGRGR